jgi:hypothetical protein
VAVSFNRYAKRADKTTRTIVEGLRARGYSVEHIGRPTDLLVGHARWGRNLFKLLECKSRKLKSGQVVLDKRQDGQREFCERHGVPYVTDVFEALLALGEEVHL